jgi:4a-hydroxytetrahydrobiopterin dehydratase
MLALTRARLAVEIDGPPRSQWGEPGGADCKTPREWEDENMADDRVLTDEELQEALKELVGWEVREGWLRRTYTTPGWPHTVMLVQTIGYLAEAAWHHPDLKIGYAKVTVMLQTHRVRGITPNDVQLARKIDEVVLWKPAPGDALEGFPKKWVH